MVFLGLREKKWTYFFHILDINNDGVLQPDDFQIVVDRLIANNSSFGNRKNFLKYQSIKLFDTLVRECAVFGERKVTLGQWIHMLKENSITKDSTFLKAFTYQIMKSLFDFFDSNGDGFIDFNEFQQMYRVYGIDDSHIYLAFQRIDQNNDQKLSRHEISEAIDVFFYSETHDDRNYLFGEFHGVSLEYWNKVIN